jgi:hypothetical protein
VPHIHPLRTNPEVGGSCHKAISLLSVVIFHYLVSQSTAMQGEEVVVLAVDALSCPRMPYLPGRAK